MRMYIIGKLENLFPEWYEECFEDEETDIFPYGIKESAFIAIDIDRITRDQIIRVFNKSISERLVEWGIAELAITYSINEKFEGFIVANDRAKFIEKIINTRGMFGDEYDANIYVLKRECSYWIHNEQIFKNMKQRKEVYYDE